MSFNVAQQHVLFMLIQTFFASFSPNSDTDNFIINALLSKRFKMGRANSKWLWLHHISSFIIICWMKTSLCWKLDNDNVLYTNRNIRESCAEYVNTMCRCFPNETHLLQISCNEITSMFKIPGEFEA